MKRWMWRKYKKVKLTQRKEMEWMADEVEGPLVGSEGSLVWSEKGRRLQKNPSITRQGESHWMPGRVGGELPVPGGDLISPFNDEEGSP